MGRKKVVVLAGYKAVTEALVNNAEQFGERDPPSKLSDGQNHGKERGEGKQIVFC